MPAMLIASLYSTSTCESDNLHLRSASYLPSLESSTQQGLRLYQRIVRGNILLDYVNDTVTVHRKNTSSEALIWCFGFY